MVHEVYDENWAHLETACDELRTSHADFMMGKRFLHVIEENINDNDKV